MVKPGLWCTAAARRCPFGCHARAATGPALEHIILVPAACALQGQDGENSCEDVVSLMPCNSPVRLLWSLVAQIYMKLHDKQYSTYINLAAS